MLNQFTENEARAKAVKRVQEIKGFYIHLTIFMVVGIISLIVGWILSYELFMVFLFSLGGWVIGVAVHGLNTFGLNIILGERWEQRKLEEFMENDKNNRHAWYHYRR